VLPALFVGPLAGVFIDRWDRRLTMIWMDFIRAALIALLFVIENLHTLNSLTGVFEAVYGVGALIGLAVMPFLVRRSGEGRVLWISLLAWGSFLLLLARMSAVLPGLAGFFLLGWGNAGVVVTTRPLMMLVTPREFMGRMQAFSESISTASALLGATLASSLVALLHHLHTVVLGMGVVMIVAGVYTMKTLGNI
jgi:MFS family permease